MRVTSSRSLSLAAALLLAGSTAAGAQGTGHFTLTSPDLKPGATIALKNVANIMGCPGQNVSKIHPSAHRGIDPPAARRKHRRHTAGQETAGRKRCSVV